MNRLALMFEIGSRIADAFRLKNEFLTAIRSDSSAVGRERPKDWPISVERMALDAFRNPARACCNKFRENLNSMDVPWTNSFAEGCNNKTKVPKRVCFGMCNFSNFRKRILFANA